LKKVGTKAAVSTPQLIAEPYQHFDEPMNALLAIRI
jgi:hypothetical protein